MTSSKNAVSLLAAAALVVTPLGNVATGYQQAHADEGDGDANHQRSEGGSPLPKSYEELMHRLSSGESFTLADLEIMKKNGVFTSEAQYASLCAQLRGEVSSMAETAVNEEPIQVESSNESTDTDGAGEVTTDDGDQTVTDGDGNGDNADGGQGSGDGDGSSAGNESNGDGSGDGSNGDGSGDTGSGSDDGTDTGTPGGGSGGEGVEGPGDGSGDGEGEVPPVADEKPVMPYYGDFENADALKAEIERLVPGITITVTEEESSLPEGTVLRVFPEQGALLSVDTEVTIAVAKAATDLPDPEDPSKPGDAEQPEAPKPADPAGDNQKPNPDGAQVPTDASQIMADIRGEAQTPLKQVAVQIPSISFTHIDNSAYVARHYSEDLTTEKFISLVGEPARNIAAESDLYASVMIAQAILESASGNSTLAQAPNNNLFGIKGVYKGQSVSLPTREDDGHGATYTITASFRQYDTVEESLSDYADLLSNSMGDFYAGARKSNTDTFVDACDFLVGRYATDIFYSEKLQDLIETYDLTRFDVPLTYELTETFVMPAKDEISGLDLYLDPVEDKAAYQALVAEYNEYVARTREYQEALTEWEEQMRLAEELYHVPVYLEKPATPAADTAMQRHQNEIDAQRFENFDKLIAANAPLPVRESRTLDDLTALATSFLGVPYLWGGTTPAGFDCSGLVQYCYREVFNIELPRTTYYQCEVGVEVPFEELLPGDLLFFDDGGDVHHVAMYLGDGYYVEAPHTGDVVKITAMNDKLPDFAKRVVEARDIDMSEFSDEQLAQFVEREKYLQEREQRLGVSDDALQELTEWLQGLTF